MLAEAEPLLRRALMGRQMKLGPKHPDTLEVMNNLAKLLQVLGGRMGRMLLIQIGCIWMDINGDSYDFDSYMK